MNAYSKIYEPILIGFLVINLQGFLFFLQLLDLFLQHRNDFLISRGFFPNRLEIELVSKELNHLAAILHVFAGVWILWSKKKIVIIFQKENGNTFTLFIIFIVKSLQKEQNSTNDPQSAGINLQSPQSDSTPWTLTLPFFVLESVSLINESKYLATSGLP